MQVVYLHEASMFLPGCIAGGTGKVREVGENPLQGMEVCKAGDICGALCRSCQATCMTCMYLEPCRPMRLDGLSD